MRLLIGLGNPGKQYENTRHNAGFLILDELQKIWKFSDFQNKPKFLAEISEGNLNGEKIILAKPQTFMNLSGRSLQTLKDFYKLETADIIIFHDDLDIELGKFKISQDSSAAGHNGVQSVFDTLGTQQIKRVRLGIEGAEAKKERVLAGSDFVLQAFSTAELSALQNLAPEISELILN